MKLQLLWALVLCLKVNMAFLFGFFWGGICWVGLHVDTITHT